MELVYAEVYGYGPCGRLVVAGQHDHLLYAALPERQNELPGILSQRIMDGDIDPFIEEYLKQQASAASAA